MSSFLSQPGMGMVRWTVWSGLAGLGLWGIAVYEGCQVFGDGHVVGVGLFDEFCFRFARYP